MTYNNTAAGSTTATPTAAATYRADGAYDRVPNDLRRLDNLDDFEIAEGEIDPRGMDVYGPTNDEIGTITGLLASPTTEMAHFAIVKSGGLLGIGAKTTLIPLEFVQFRDGDAYVPFTADQLKQAPDYNSDERDPDDFLAYFSGLSATRTTAPRTATSTTAALDGDGTGRDTERNGEEIVVPVIEEHLNVGKRVVERGLRIHSRIVEQPVQERVTLREEEIHVERRPVDRPAGEADLNAIRESTITVTETNEVPVVAKEARVVAEVVVGKEATQRTETVQDTVRRTHVDVDEDLRDEDTRRMERAEPAGRV